MLFSVGDAKLISCINKNDTYDTPFEIWRQVIKKTFLCLFMENIMFSY